MRTGRAEEPRVPEGEHAAVGRHEPIPVSGGRRRDAGHRLVETHAAGRPEEARVAEGEDPAVGRYEPVALPGHGRSDADDLFAQRHVGGVAVGRRLTLGLDLAVRPDDPVAVTRGIRREADRDLGGTVGRDAGPGPPIPSRAARGRARSRRGAERRAASEYAGATGRSDASPRCARGRGTVGRDGTDGRRERESAPQRWHALQARRHQVLTAGTRLHESLSGPPGSPQHIIGTSRDFLQSRPSILTSSCGRTSAFPDSSTGGMPHSDPSVRNKWGW